jgi:hypothetical protein
MMILFALATAVSGLAVAFALWLMWVFAFMPDPPPDYLDKYSGYLAQRYDGSTKFD